MSEFIPSDAQQKLVREAQERALAEAASGHPVPDELLRRMQSEEVVAEELPVRRASAALRPSFLQRLKSWLLGSSSK